MTFRLRIELLVELATIRARHGSRRESEGKAAEEGEGLRTSHFGLKRVDTST